VVIYAGATILGGETKIGNDCVIGGSVWLTHSVEAGKMVLARAAVTDSTLKRDVMHPSLPEDSAML
jgi:UDP-3-O-[3-hydroxymyristoyl] glucosamine N-acyltransferase